MSNHREEYIHPTWPNVDEDDILMKVAQAFRGTELVYPDTMISVYNIIFHNAEMTRWTAHVSTTDVVGVRYYEIYFGTKPIFVA